MALSRTDIALASSGDAHGSGQFNTGSFTPANNSLLVVCCGSIASSDDGSNGGSLTVTSSAGLAWTSRVASGASPPGGWSYGGRIWTAPVTTGTSMTVGVAGMNAYKHFVGVFVYTGYDTATPTGATASGTDADGQGAASITLSGAPASTSEVVGLAVLTSAGGSIAVTNGTGWTEVHEGQLTDWGAMQTQVRGGSTSTTVGWDDLDSLTGAAGAVLLAVEIKAAGGGGGGSTYAPVLAKSSAARIAPLLRF